MAAATPVQRVATGRFFKRISGVHNRPVKFFVISTPLIVLLAACSGGGGGLPAPSSPWIQEPGPANIAKPPTATDPPDGGEDDTPDEKDGDDGGDNGSDVTSGEGPVAIDINNPGGNNPGANPTTGGNNPNPEKPVTPMKPEQPPPGTNPPAPPQVPPGSTPDIPTGMPVTVPTGITDGYSRCLGARYSVTTDQAGPDKPVIGFVIEGVARFAHKVEDDLDSYGRRLHIVAGGNQGEDMRRVAHECLAPRTNHHYYEIFNGITPEGPDLSGTVAKTDQALRASDAQKGADVIAVVHPVEDRDKFFTTGDAKATAGCRALLVMPAGITVDGADECTLFVGVLPLDGDATEPEVPCGILKENCITAPGTYPVASVDQSNMPEGITEYVSGSGMATAATGALLAAVARRWDYLTPEAVRNVALRCADQARPPGQSDVPGGKGATTRHGRGYLTMACLFTPAGELVLDPENLLLVRGHVSVAGLTDVARITAYDDYGRDFSVPVAFPLLLPLSEMPRLTEGGSVWLYGDENRTGLVIGKETWQLNMEYIDPLSPLSPVRGTGSFINGSILALSAHIDSAYDLTTDIKAFGGVSCRYEHMLPETGSLLRAYDAALCNLRSGLNMALGRGWTASVNASIISPRTGRVRLAGRSIPLGGNILTEAQASLVLEF
ncbi:MAG: hypothetical protein V6Z81_10480 [Parvularculales bacterium]